MLVYLIGSSILAKYLGWFKSVLKERTKIFRLVQVWVSKIFMLITNYALCYTTWIAATLYWTLLQSFLFFFPF
jgi:hypothetical protein